MEALLFGGVFDLPWWGDALVALGLTHVTIVAVTIFLHRHQAHRELAAIWARSSATREQLVGRLQDWCRRADASAISPLKELAERMRSYA